MGADGQPHPEDLVSPDGGKRHRSHRSHHHHHKRSREVAEDSELRQILGNDIELTENGTLRRKKKSSSRSSLQLKFLQTCSIGLIWIALLLYSTPIRPLGPLPDPYPNPRGYLIHTGQKIK